MIGSVTEPLEWRKRLRKSRCCQSRTTNGYRLKRFIVEVTVRDTATRFLNRQPTIIPRLPNEVSECRGETDSIELTLGLYSLYECLVKCNGFGEVFQRLRGLSAFYRR